MSGAWFVWRERSSLEMGARLIEAPARTLTALRGTAYRVVGRSGSAFVSDGCYEDAQVRIRFSVANPADIPRTDAWLTGAGGLRLGDEPSLLWDARIVKPPTRQAAAPRLPEQIYEVTFTCAPLKQLYPPEPVRGFDAPGALFNPGTAPSRPVVTVRGSGCFQVTCGAGTMHFRDIEGGAIIDGETGDALTLDRTRLLNAQVSGAPFELAPGNNLIAWTEGDGENAGRVDRVEVLPEWRFL